jgi:hypothetical protein
MSAVAEGCGGRELYRSGNHGTIRRCGYSCSNRMRDGAGPRNRAVRAIIQELFDGAVAFWKAVIFTATLRAPSRNSATSRPRSPKRKG